MAGLTWEAWCRGQGYVPAVQRYLPTGYTCETRPSYKNDGDKREAARERRGA